jgi:hypothetical protein
VASCSTRRILWSTRARADFESAPG